CRMTVENYKSIIGIVVKITDTKFNNTSLTRVAKILDKEMLKILIIEFQQKRNHPMRLSGLGVKGGESDVTQRAGVYE
ncbi:DNA polymerase IV, partial [Francisella tularensis subsp. holarctica]|nr:DNA polymerase IV [Francisella tularensis subsp. holarctica]